MNKNSENLSRTTEIESASQQKLKYEKVTALTRLIAAIATLLRSIIELIHILHR